jgi:hypothetical protein
MNMQERDMHLVCFDVPHPPDYGGVIDIFYKIRALHKIGIRIHLHCYQYGRKEADILNELCISVNYYQRNASKTGLFNRLPYIVVSRSSEELIRNLLKDEHPILFEGLHTCYFLSDPRLEKRDKFVRTHNIEHDYYENLASVERNIFKRYYFHNEAEKLRVFERSLEHAQCIFAISPNDQEYFNENFGRSEYIPAFHPNEKVCSRTGKGDFALYHGNLSIGENNEAALYLIREVFNDLDLKLIIAGSRPSQVLKREVSKHDNIELAGNIPTEKIHQLISDAQINILPTFQPTGIKLKLLSALFSGRHCITNDIMTDNTGLESLCLTGSSPQALKSHILNTKDLAFTDADIKLRKDVLGNQFSNLKNAELLSKMIFS